jgi:hypothetical protein
LACEFPCEKREEVEVIVRQNKIELVGFHELERK